jgi:hypothetical protein
MHVAPDRNDEAAADSELLLERVGDFRAAGRNDDGVERRLPRQPERAVGPDDLDIVVAEMFQAFLRLVGKLLCRSMA